MPYVAYKRNIKCYVVLDKFYELYERDFTDEQQKDLKSIFNLVLGEVVKILPNINKTRWGKKTDFYTIFLVFANHGDKLPLTRDGRTLASTKLVDFAADIDRFVNVKAGIPENPVYGRTTRDYSAGVRASTDLGSRKKRADGYSGPCRPRFRRDGDHCSDLMATGIPLASRPLFR